MANAMHTAYELIVIGSTMVTSEGENLTFSKIKDMAAFLDTIDDTIKNGLNAHTFVTEFLQGIAHSPNLEQIQKNLLTSARIVLGEIVKNGATMTTLYSMCEEVALITLGHIGVTCPSGAEVITATGSEVGLAGPQKIQWVKRNRSIIDNGFDSDWANQVRNLYKELGLNQK